MQGTPWFANLSYSVAASVGFSHDGHMSWRPDSPIPWGIYDVISTYFQQLAIYFLNYILHSVCSCVTFIATCNINHDCSDIVFSCFISMADHHWHVFSGVPQLSLPLYLRIYPSPHPVGLFILSNFIFNVFPSRNDAAPGLIGDIKITHLLEDGGCCEEQGAYTL